MKNFLHNQDAYAEFPKNACIIDYDRDKGRVLLVFKDFKKEIRESEEIATFIEEAKKAFPEIEQDFQSGYRILYWNTNSKIYFVFHRPTEAGEYFFSPGQEVLTVKKFRVYEKGVMIASSDRLEDLKYGFNKIFVQPVNRADVIPFLSISAF